MKSLESVLNIYGIRIRPMAILTLAVIIVIIVLAPLCYADDCSPLQISLWPSAQLVSKDSAICGLRWNLLYGQNTAVNGLDLGIANRVKSIKGIQIGGLNVADGNAYGIQLGLANGAEGNAYGIQLGALNYNGKEVYGLQIGGMSGARAVHGVQIGFLNDSKLIMEGVQVGFLNLAKSNVHGVQIGLLNWCNTLDGVQIGLANIVASRYSAGGVFFAPLINFGF